MLKELDTIVLNVDLPNQKLRAGDLETIVLDHRGAGYEVEFVTLEGRTLAVVTLDVGQVRPVHSGEIASARSVA